MWDTYVQASMDQLIQTSDNGYLWDWRFDRGDTQGRTLQ